MNLFRGLYDGYIRRVEKLDLNRHVKMLCLYAKQYKLDLYRIAYKETLPRGRILGGLFDTDHH